MPNQPQAAGRVFADLTVTAVFEVASHGWIDIVDLEQDSASVRCGNGRADL